MNSQNLVPKGIAIFLSILIPISFVLFVDWVKKKAASKLMRKRQEKTNKEFHDFSRTLEFEMKEKHSYREGELKFFLPYSFAYLFVLILLFLIIGPYFNFNLIEIYFSSKYNNSLKDKFIGTIMILTFNFILYSGLLIQIFNGNEIIYPKTSFCFFMENMYGPLLEEVIYRGLLFTLLKQAGYHGIKSAIFSSLTFSLSHFRHIFDVYFTKRMIPHLFFQSFYTLLFGFYTCYAYNYSGTIIAPSLLHSVCNTLQMPRFDYLSDESISKFKRHLISGTYIIGILGWIILVSKYH